MKKRLRLAFASFAPIPRKNWFYYIVPFLLLFTSFSQLRKAYQYPYKDPGLPVESRIDDLLGRMTITEKIKQLDMYWGKEVANMEGHEASSYAEEKVAASLGNTGAGSVHDLYPLSAEISNRIQHYALEKTRLGIPVLFIEEGLHGYSGLGSTSFPIPIELASAWDTVLVQEIGHTIAMETRAHGVDMILGPVLCLPRDPRWGRVEETYGEDPYLAALNGVAMVKGMQGGDVSRHDAVVAEPKHFAVHGIPEAGSNTSPVNIGEREARSAFLPVFEKAVKEGGALAMMAAYSEIDGIPCVDNKWLLTDVLRKEWGFKGFVLSDLGAIKMTIENHHTASGIGDAMAQTLKAGLNMQFYDFGHEDFLKAMTRDIHDGTLSIAELNRAVSDVLRIKFLLGLFDHPYIDTALKARVFHTSENQDLALKAAREGICLLKNEGLPGILPFKSSIRSLAVIGPLAASTYLGGYSNEAGRAISILDGLRQRAGNSLTINYEKGYSADMAKGNSANEAKGNGADTLSNAADTLSMASAASGLARAASDLVRKAVDLVLQSDAAVVVLGEDPGIVGEGKDRAGLDLGDRQMDLIKALKATGKPIVVVLCNGRPLCINWVAANVPSIVEAWFSGEKAGLAIADVLLGKTNPSGKLPMTFPRSVGQIPFYYNHKPTSHHNYVDESDTPLFPFGHGLSYTHFDYSGLTVQPASIPVKGQATVQVTIKNTGDREGSEVVQLYLRDVVSSVTTPAEALKGFGRVSLQPGESKVVRFAIGPEQLALWNREMKHVVEPGEFKIMVGSSSADIRLTDSLWVK
jgi:beta-glucosidase